MMCGEKDEQREQYEITRFFSIEFIQLFAN